MSKRLLRICSILLALVMFINMLPHQVMADVLKTEILELSDNAVQLNTNNNAQIVEEVVGKRSEYSKEYKLSNGMHMATVYGDAVHYEENGQWKEIDNTLVSKFSDGTAVYTNTAGVWDISFPAQLGDNSFVKLNKNGHILKFNMAGMITNVGAVTMSNNASTMSLDEEQNQGLLTVRGIQPAEAQLDNAEETEQLGYAEAAAKKTSSRIRYNSIAENTHVVYDVIANTVKESIVIESYDVSLRGYQFNLEVTDMIPVLNEDNSIWFYDSTMEEVIMVMPAPFVVDAANAFSNDVRVILRGSGSRYALYYYLPQSWLSDDARQWPVVLDPAVSSDLTQTNVRDITLTENDAYDNNSTTLAVGHNKSKGKSRVFLKYTEIPNLSSADVIVSAIVGLYRFETLNSGTVVEVHKVQGTWASESIKWATQPDYDPNVEDFVPSGSKGYNYFDVTDIVRGWYEGDNTGMMFKAPDSIESITTTKLVNFYSSDAWTSTSAYRPALVIFFRNNNGLESYWDYTSSSAGRAGTGYINNYTGNLVWVRNDMGFGGNRMPVSINHIYNANDSLNNTFGMGYGWRTNFNQRVYEWSEDSNYYVWEDADGTKHYFLYDEEDQKYKDEDGLELILDDSGSGESTYKITDKYGNISYFDSYGRLRKMENNQATKSSINITYTTTSGYLISTIEDGVNRQYTFSYSGGLLNQISYTGTGSAELSDVSFGYSGSQLTSITDADGKSVSYAYTTNYLLSSVTDVDGYKLAYTYNVIATGKPSRVASVVESDGSVYGGTLTISYAHNQTTFTDYNGNKQIVQFNNWGNTVSIQDGQGRAQYAQYASNSMDDGGKGNQLTMSSKLQNTVGNMLINNSFEAGGNWSVVNSNVTISYDGPGYMGSKSLVVTRDVAGSASGVMTTFTAEPNTTYTFSAYVKTGSGAAYLALNDGSTTVTSETMEANSGWSRLEVSYTNSGTAAKTVTAQLMTADAGTVYMDCIQVEKAPTASRFNLIENGDFTFTTGWSATSGRTTGTQAAPQLSTNVYSLTGAPKATNRISQTVNIGGGAGDTFVLAGWAMGNAATLQDLNDLGKEREFGLIAQFNYTDGTTSLSNTDTAKNFKVHFNTDVDNWQYIAAPMVAEKAYSSITVYIAYDYNVNTAYFDGIQLYKEQFGNSYTYDEDGNVVSVVDLQKKTTTYEYDSNNNLTQMLQDNVAKMTYTYDDYHNVLTATSAEGLVYNFAYDAYGNNTSVSISNGTVAMTSSAAYSADGNRLLSTTDAAGNTTTYEYDANTNVLLSVQYPNGAATKTEYQYDTMYRLASASAMAGTETLAAQYTYTDDLLTKLETKSTVYNFGYGNFGLRSSIKVGTSTLATYTYTSRNNYLETLAYGNGDRVQYTYDTLGRVTQETYEDGDTVTYAYDNDGALATVTDSATGRKTTYYYDFTDRLMKYVEQGSGYSHSVGYTYDTLNNLTQLVETINGTERTTSYAYDDDNRVTGITNGSSAREYTYDAYGRVSSRVTKHAGTTVSTDTITYRTVNGKATGQISKLVNKAGTFQYTYDANGNIKTAVFGGKTTTYTYDSQNQLTREDNQAAGKSWVWTYDDAGNILSKKEYAYTTGTLGSVLNTVSYGYGNTNWGDLLTSWGGKTITSDAIGNMTSDGTWTYTWEHGRELASMTGGGVTWTFTYDANGMRTSRTNGSTTYSYVYNGGQLSQMTVGGNTLNFTYDASGTPLSVVYNGTYYYYVTNLQGDVVAILDHTGAAQVCYTYDAWGRVMSTTEDMASTLGVLNPLRYRGYVYDPETSLYYLQSRYYNPALGRFINADALSSTGQGLLGNNMFAYCLNNPVNGCDPCGTCFHRLDFWNDCEKCGGKTLGEKLNTFATEIYDYGIDVYDAHMMQNEWQRQVDQNSFRAMRDSTVAVCDAYIQGYNRQQELQLAETQMTLEYRLRIIGAGLEGGTEAAIFAISYNKMANTSENNVLVSFAAGAVAGSLMEIYNIVKEVLFE